MILLLDTSKHNGIIDVGQAKAQGVSAIAGRCTVGNYYCDRLDTDEMGENFARLWDNCKQHEMPVSVYNVIMPAYTDGGNDRISADEHLDWFFTWFANRQPDFPIIWDCEKSRYQTYDWITAVIQGCVKGTKGFGGFDYPMIYTRQSWWDAHVKPWSEWHKCPLFVAWYPYKYGVVNSFYVDFPPENIRPWLPRDWKEANKDFSAWQYSADGNDQGARFGARSKAIDLSMADEKVFLSLPIIPPPIEPPVEAEPYVADINVSNNLGTWAGSVELEKV
jgi:GH25 family lysozyme M1 (1,4-beta-N-acetylmuramidase)